MKFITISINIDIENFFKGELRDWWNDDTSKAFARKAFDMVNHYNHYNVDQVNMSVNGINTLGENIADIGGLKAAYSGYGKFFRSNMK